MSPQLEFSLPRVKWGGYEDEVGFERGGVAVIDCGDLGEGRIQAGGRGVSGIREETAETYGAEAASGGIRDDVVFDAVLRAVLFDYFVGKEGDLRGGVAVPDAGDHISELGALVSLLMERMRIGGRDVYL